MNKTLVNENYKSINRFIFGNAFINTNVNVIEVDIYNNFYQVTLSQ